MKKKTPGITSGLICAGIVGASVLFVLGLVFYPGIRARTEVRKMKNEMKKGAAEVLISDLGLFGFEDEGTGETLLTGEKADAYSRELAALLGRARYTGKKDVTGGNWDVRVIITFSDGGRAVLYDPGDGSLYFTRGITRFTFSLPAGASFPAAG